jgi:hypothetical protein
MHALRRYSANGFAILLLCLVAICATTTLFVACSTGSTATPAQQYVTVATNATQAVDQITLAADAAVKAGLLKGADAQNTLAVIRDAQAALAVAATMAPADPGGAVSKVNLALATLAATQAYLATLGAKK